VVAAAAGAAHTLLLCADGAVLATGAGEDGALGLDDARDKALPLPLPPWPGGARVVALAAGGYASAFIARDRDATGASPSLRPPCPAAALEAALAAVESGDGGGGAAAHARCVKAVCAAVEAALGSCLGAAAAFALPAPDEPASASATSAPPSPNSAGPAPPAALVDAARLEALSVRCLLLARAAPEVLVALRTAQERLVEELCGHAEALRQREHAAALAAAEWCGVGRAPPARALPARGGGAAPRAPPAAPGLGRHARRTAGVALRAPAAGLRRR